MAESEIKIRDDLLQRLQMKSEQKGIHTDELIEEFLDAADEEDRIFEERTCKALECVEARGIKGKPATELLKEMDIAEDSNEEPEMIRLADKFSELKGICDDSEITDPIELRDTVRERRL